MHSLHLTFENFKQFELEAVDSQVNLSIDTIDPGLHSKQVS